MQEFIKVFKALSDETRLRILRLLMERECCVCEVMQALDISQTRASRNLGILQNAGLVRSRREGLWVVYSLNEEHLRRFPIPPTEFVKSSLDETFAQDRERLKKASRIGPRAVQRARRMKGKGF
jgi:ArsR family transcriptional regulator